MSSINCPSFRSRLGRSNGLVDNGSEPDQLQLLSDWFSAAKHQFAELLFIAASRNLGANGGRNLAFQLPLAAIF